MAVTKSLKLLTAAALALPLTTIYASDEEATFQYGHYEEGARNLFNAKSDFKPIQVDSIQTNTKLKLSDRIRLAFNYTQDTWSGATPVSTAPLVFKANLKKRDGKIVSGASPRLQGESGSLYVDKYFNPLEKIGDKYVANNQLVHTLSTASPETRKQGDLYFGYDWDEASLDFGAGTSSEPDYESNFGNVSGRFDFNKKLTSLNWGASYTSSTTQATVDHDAAIYFENTSSYIQNLKYGTPVQDVGNTKVINGSKEDWSGNLGFTQILNKSALIQGSISYTSSNGYMANPYKAVDVIFVDPEKKPDATGRISVDMRAFLDKRPDERKQWTENLRYVQHIDALDASFHFDYRFYHDDWGINAHTFSGDWIQPLGNGWSITPRVRYYSQEGADFYTPYLVSKQPIIKTLYNEEGNRIGTQKYNPKLLPQNYSSDYRLSGYGALSGGLTVTKKFAKGLEFQAGAEYYTHAGNLKLGGVGEGSYSDFDGYLLNAALKVDLATLSTSNSAHSEHSNHAHHGHHHGAGAPAGVMFDHVLPNAGDVMVGYRYMYANQAGATQNGTKTIIDPMIVHYGCETQKCFVTPEEMSMNMHMLDLMYAPTDWLTLMLMPQFMDMHMTMRPLDGAPETPSMTTPLGAAILHAEHEHTTGGVGDTGIYALFNVFKTENQQINITLGGTAPTGDSAIQLRDTHKVDLGFIHYGMQLGSGTWDFKPAITYNANIQDWSFGTQLNATKRLENSNDSGFALGDIFQATGWSSYSWTNWLATSVRGIYTWQGQLKGFYNGPYRHIGAMDYGQNYGGRFVDVGFGINASMPNGSLQGNRVSFEWLQPVHDDVNGYQLPREGALSATWSYAF